MNCKDLIKILEKQPPETLVVISSDSEGNRYSILDGVDSEAACKKDYNGELEIGVRELTPELKQQGYSSEDVVKGKKCVILYPP